jgi:hypothetical protein
LHGAIKGYMHKLESVIRRRRYVESEIKIEAHRKNMKKAIVKAIRNLTVMKNVSTASKDNDSETFSMLSILKEAEAITVNSLESWLIFITTSKHFLM